MKIGDFIVELKWLGLTVIGQLLKPFKPKGFVCYWTSRWERYGVNIHDYHEKYGGDSHPSHFAQYKCKMCQRPFWI